MTARKKNMRRKRKKQRQNKVKGLAERVNRNNTLEVFERLMTAERKRLKFRVKLNSIISTYKSSGA
ncbi:hypothetical protein [Neisseria wadsworthii]|uniref:hypothetical protein n=1 Tax=Neisseria wadsworthii TaxID=607711 RepID=UPI000D302BDE|nr:hypothetical protein [Neisseria wadsworthii]